MPVTNPVNGQLCDITDLAQDVYSLMVRVALLESRQNQMINSNVTSVYLSDFSPDMGYIDGGTLGPLVTINTVQDYAMYAYTYEGGQLEVVSTTIEITRNEGNAVEAGVLTSTLAKRFINFKVHKDGLYHFSLGANIRIGGFDPGVTDLNLSYALQINAGTLPNTTDPTDHGFQLHGTVVDYLNSNATFFYAGAPIDSSPGVDLSGFSESDYLRLKAEDEVHMIFAPNLRTNTVTPNSAVEIENINVVLLRVSNL